MKKLTHSKSKAHWWRMGLIWGFILAFGVINFGCEKCECDPDEYYIKYAVGVESGRVSNVPIDIEIINEYGDKVSYSDTDTWNITVGSVEDDFTASLSIELGQFAGDATLTANIQVRKNDGPFVVKASGESADLNDPVQIDYTIDF